MCHMDSLKISKQDFPSPKPFKEAGKLISNVIDNRLHLSNHVDPKGKVMYIADDKTINSVLLCVYNE